MTTITTTAPAVDNFHRAKGAASVPKAPTPGVGRTYNSSAVSPASSFLITYATSIPPVLTLYVPALSDPAFILGGPSTRA